VFVGHFAVAFAAKRAVPTVSLGTWFVACELVDLVWPVFVLAGIETVRIAPGITAFTPLDFGHYPWTHSLVMVVVWSAAMGALYWARNRVAAMVIGLVAHRPDLPLAPGSDMKLGFGLWNSVPGTQALDRIGRFGLWALVALLLVAYAGAAAGPPPSVQAVAWAGILGGVFTAALGYWVDAHRTMKA